MGPRLTSLGCLLSCKHGRHSKHTHQFHPARHPRQPGPHAAAACRPAGRLVYHRQPLGGRRDGAAAGGAYRHQRPGRGGRHRRCRSRCGRHRSRGASDPAAFPPPPRRAHHQAHGADAVGRRLLHSRREGRRQVQGLPAAAPLPQAPVRRLRRRNRPPRRGIRRPRRGAGDCRKRPQAAALLPAAGSALGHPQRPRGVRLAA